MSLQTITYEDLIDPTKKELKSNYIRRAFGVEGLGIGLVQYPDTETRNKALRSIYKFAKLKKCDQKQYVDEASKYSFGWSHGVESMKSGKPDTAKGSFYLNPFSDTVPDATDKEMEKFPEIFGSNRWPDHHVPGFSKSIKDQSLVMKDIGLRICKELDAYMSSKHGEMNLLDKLQRCKSHKGRALHYFPKTKTEDTAVDSSIDGLCGWHLDHGFITILGCPLFLDEEGRRIEKPTDRCGLHIKSPIDGSNVPIDIPEDCLAIQLGEMAQFFSGGHLRATPHCVATSKKTNITREQYVLFLDGPPGEALILPNYSKPYDEVVATPYLPPNIPLLKDRLKGTKIYREYVKATIHAYNA